MPILKLNDAELYYEVHGEGDPVLFLNGIMMSTASWAAFLPVLSGKFRLILLDFRDQGQSSRMQGAYNYAIHVGDIIRLLDHLEFPRVHVMGLSYGGQVALQLALQHMERIQSLALFNTPSRITQRLLEIGRAWEAAAEVLDGASFFQLALPFIYSEPFYETHMEFMKERRGLFESMLTREWFEAFTRLSRSVENFRISPEELRTISAPALVVGADQDSVVSREAMRDLHENIPGCEFVMIPNSGHAAFLEKMNEFMTILIGFVIKNAQKIL